jgi:hypothetical protein
MRGSSAAVRNCDIGCELSAVGIHTDLQSSRSGSQTARSANRPGLALLVPSERGSRAGGEAGGEKRHNRK